jgi:hypothetical protein
MANFLGSSRKKSPQHSPVKTLNFKPENAAIEDSLPASASVDSGSNSSQASEPKKRKATGTRGSKKKGAVSVDTQKVKCLCLESSLLEIQRVSNLE